MGKTNVKTTTINTSRRT
jgi:hypothetical protein